MPSSNGMSRVGESLVLLSIFARVTHCDKMLKEKSLSRQPIITCAPRCSYDSRRDEFKQSKAMRKDCNGWNLESERCILL